MTSLQRIGWDLQDSASSIEEADKRFADTCEECAKHGLNQGRDYCNHRCEVAIKHSIVTAAFKTKEELCKRTYQIKGTITLDMQIEEVII